MHKAFYDALKSGGELVVGDYSAKPGAGTSVVQTLHRSDEALVTSEIEAAGFKLIDHGDFLRVPGDARDAHSHNAAQPDLRTEISEAGLSPADGLAPCESDRRLSCGVRRPVS
jgi:predicted methyltransferase